MRRSKLVAHLILFFMIPSLILYPQAHLPVQNEIIQISPLDSFLSYDDMLNLIDAIEVGELEKRCSEDDLEKINHLLANLAKQGNLSNEEEGDSVLENDIQELLHSEDNPFKFCSSFSQNNYVIFPAVFSGQGEIFLCKSWIQKKWHQTKKFIKHHKKAIIIGAAVAVGAAVAICAVATAVTTCAAAAGGVVASSESSKNEKDKAKDQKIAILPPPSMPYMDSAPVIVTSHETPILKAVLDEHVSTFKEVVVEKELLQDSALKTPSSFSEQLRNLGAGLAHEILQGVSNLVQTVPHLLEEVKNLGSLVLPQYLLPSANGTEIMPKENFEKLIAEGHEKIDEVFSTDQVEYISAINEANDRFVIGIVPLPGTLCEIFTSNDKLAEAGRVFDRAGFTKAGRGLMKHGYRENSVFQKPVGTPSEINEQGQKILESILNHPERKVIHKNSKNFGEIVDICAPKIGGIRYNSSGEMIGFLEP